jgi:biotin carboxylase
MAAKTKTRRKATGKAAPKPAKKRRPFLHGISDIRRFFHRNETPYYFVSATNFNLLNMDAWVRRFRFVNYVDCFDGLNPHILVPKPKSTQAFQSLEEIVNHLLQHKEVVDHVRGRPPGGKALFLFFDEQTERLAKDLGLEVAFPSAKLRALVGNKIETVRIGNRAGVKSVPNVLAKVDSWKALKRVSRKLGDDLVVQTAYGDSGHTTFFIRSEKDFDEHAKEIVEAPEVKVMRRITCRSSAIEACVTRHGIIVGPLMTELIGFPELTPYRGGWCGNEVFAGAFSKRIRDRAREMVVKFGTEIRKLGYRGYFELDLLMDTETGELYLGECNPRITGASSMTNLAAFAHADAPLFLFHLLEFADVDYDLDVDALNARWADPTNIDPWSQLVMKHTGDSVDLVTVAPPSGVWKMAPDGTVSFAYVQTHRRRVENEDEAFWLRITGPGDWRYKGGDLGILLTPGRLMTDDFQLTDRARAWIRGMQAQYGVGFPGAATPPPAAAPRPAQVGSFKIH